MSEPKKSRFFPMLLASLVVFGISSASTSSHAEEADAFIASAETRLMNALRRNVQLQWNYETNITEHNEKALLEDKVVLGHIKENNTVPLHDLCNLVLFYSFYRFLFFLCTIVV